MKEHRWILMSITELDAEVTYVEKPRKVFVKATVNPDLTRK
jgi:hypothetical protein